MSRKELIHLCDRIVFEFDKHLSDREVKTLSRLAMQYQGRATDYEMSLIFDICDRCGLAFEGVSA